MTMVAHVDEAGARLPNGRRLYVIVAAVSSIIDEPKIIGAITPLQISSEIPLHFRTERTERRVAVAQAIAAAPLYGAVLLSTSATNTGQERARTRLLCDLLPRLEQVEKVGHVVLESRAGGDRHDRRTRDRLRRSRQITAALRMDHANKSTPMLWPADWIASSYIAAHHHHEHEAWDIINAGHLVEITEITPR